MSKLGLVFSGGGGKGAYEIGVWKALQEFDIANNIQAVAGTSVGALNGALFLKGDHNVGEELWHNISPEQILTIDIEHLAEKGAKLAAKLALNPQMILSLATKLQGRGWFSQKGLSQLIRQSGVCSAVRDSEIPFHVCALNGNTGQLAFPCLNGRTDDEIEKWLLASAAIPCVFSAVEIDGEHYHDGGVLPGLSNNTPYEPLIQEHNCTHIISVFLSDAPLMIQKQQRYPATNFWNIVPSTSFKDSGFIPAINFTAENARELMERGYYDAKTILMRFREFQQTEEVTLKHTADIELSSRKHQQQVRANGDIRHGTNADPENPLQLLDELRAEIDRRELDLIDAGLDEFLERNTHNSQAMQEVMFEGIATLASTEGRIKHAMNRGLLSRVWGGITGKTEKQSAEIQWDLSRAIYCNQRLVQKLAERNALTLEAVASLSTRLNYVMGHTNYLTAASNLHQKAIKVLANEVGRLQMDMHRRCCRIEARLEQVESRTDLQMWLLGLPQEFVTLSPPQAVLLTVKKFYGYTNGNWKTDEYGALAGQLATCGNSKSSSLQAIADAAHDQNILTEPERFLPPGNETAITHPAYSVIHPASSNPLAQLEQRGICSTTEIPIMPLVAELLCSMRMRDMRRGDILEDYLTKAQELQQLCADTGLEEYRQPLQHWMQEMKDYRILAPLIGKFSAGKSTLLNAILGQELLGVDINPETADASELRYAAHPYAEGIYLDGKQQPCTDVAATLPSPEPNPLWYYRRHINNPILKNLGKLVLVDMPGLDSNKFNHEKALANYIERGEVFLGVLSSDAAFDESVMRVLREANTSGKEIHLAVTKCGRQSEEKLQEIRQSLHNFFSGVDPQPEIALVESREGDPGIDDFISILFRLACRFNDFFKARFESTLQDFQNQIRNKLDRELKLANCDDVELKQAMAAEQQIFAELANAVRNEQRALNKKLNGEGIEQVANAALNVLSGEETRLLDAIESRTLQQTIASIIRPVVQHEVKRVVDEAIAEFTKRVESAIDQPQISLDVAIAVMNPEMKSGNSGNVAAAIGAIIGSFLPIPGAALIGAALGKVLGDNKEEVQQENRTLIHNQVIPQVISSVRQQLQQKFVELAAQVADSTQKYLDDQRQTMETRRSQMLENLQQKRLEFEARQENLRQAIAALEAPCQQNIPCAL